MITGLAADARNKQRCDTVRKSLVLRMGEDDCWDGSRVQRIRGGRR